MSAAPRRRRVSAQRNATDSVRLALREYAAAAGKLGISRRDLTRLEKLLSLIDGLAEVIVERVGERHLRFAARKKTFAYYLNDHHGDGIVCICCKATRARQAELLRDREHYAMPAYLGVSGWVSLRLDRRTVKWDDALVLLVDAYRLQAPRRLVDEM